jgi:glycosyltransferase involved in cell wall biosynthesis
MLGRSLTRAAARSGHPVIATNHFMPENVLPHIPVLRGFPEHVTRLAWRDLGRIYQLADLVTAPTPRAVELLESSVGLRGVRAISCGIDVERYWLAAQAAPVGMVPTVLFVGRLESEKRVDELLRAYARVPRGLESRMEIIGTGSQGERLRSLAAALGIAPRVTFRGRVSDAELAAAYGASDIFCIPGIAELQSLVTLEAMSAGKPVIAANAMALPHLVQPGRNGYLYTPGDLAGLAAHLTTLITQPGLRHTMGRASRRMVDEHTIGATLDAFEGCYAEILGRPRSTSTPAQSRVRRYMVPAFSPATATLRRARTKAQKNGIAA